MCLWSTRTITSGGGDRIWLPWLKDAVKAKGREIADRLRPAKDDYLVLKPKHSAFFSTTLDTLLQYQGTLVVDGFAADICVLFTANDAYMGDLRLIIPCDGVASNESKDCETALALMHRVLKAKTLPTEEIDFDR